MSFTHAEVLAVEERTEQLVEDVRSHVLALEERVAFAEQARDNAVKMRDDADARRKQAGESAGRRIKELVRLVRHLARHYSADQEHVEVLIADILSKDTLTTSSTPDLPPSLPAQFLHNADPKCQHYIIDASGGGVKCTKCCGWFCF